MITGNIITLNESENIVECIESLKPICDEIIVVDSLSSDDTVELAEAHGAKVVKQAYLGDGPQKNVAAEHAKNDWILSLDADERITPELAEEIKALDLANATVEGFAIARRWHIGERWIKHCGWYPDHTLRLYHKDRTRYLEKKAHSSVPAKNRIKLKHDMLHYSFDNIGQLFAKPNRNYSARSAKIMFLKGKKVSPIAPVTHSIFAFLRHYVFHRGFLDGLDGLTVCISIAVYTYMKYAQLIEFQRDKSVRDAEDFDKVW